MSNDGYQKFAARVLDSANHVYGVNFEKVRRKTKRTMIKSGLNKGKFKTEVIRKAHWTANVYKFDLALLKAAGKKLVQYNRYFRLVDV